jgi:pilus assembly protein CpaE
MTNKPGDKKIRVVIVDDIPETRENLKKILMFETDIEVVGMASTGREGVDVARAQKPDVILMDINMPDMDGIQATELINKAVPSVGIVMMSVQHEADYLRRAMLAGARDFLTKPIAGDELYATIRRVYEVRPTNVQVLPPPDDDPRRPRSSTVSGARGGHMIVVYSPQGGAGKTTVATNLAASLMRADTKVLLIDADLQFGDVGVFLNLVAQATISTLIKTAFEDELDTDLVENVLIKHDSGLKVLLSPPTPQEAIAIDPQAVLSLVGKMRSMFDFIVIDTSTDLSDLNLGLFDMADRIVLVMLPTLPALKNMRIVLNVMDQLGYHPDKTPLVFNRINPEFERAKVIPPLDKLEERLKRKALISIPVDEKRVLSALTRGTPVIASKERTISPAKEFIALGDLLRASLQPVEAETAAASSSAKSSRFSRLLGGS